MARIVSVYPFNDKSLGRKICLRYQVYVTLVRDLNHTAIFLSKNPSSVPRCLHCKVKQENSSRPLIKRKVTPELRPHPSALVDLLRQLPFADINIEFRPDAKIAFEVDAGFDREACCAELFVNPRFQIIDVGSVPCTSSPIECPVRCMNCAP